jgi:hypothetical protein
MYFANVRFEAFTTDKFTEIILVCQLCQCQVKSQCFRHLQLHNQDQSGELPYITDMPPPARALLESGASCRIIHQILHDVCPLISVLCSLVCPSWNLSPRILFNLCMPENFNRLVVGLCVLLSLNPSSLLTVLQCNLISIACLTSCSM